MQHTHSTRRNVAAVVLLTTLLLIPGATLAAPPPAEPPPGRAFGTAAIAEVLVQPLTRAWGRLSAALRGLTAAPSGELDPSGADSATERIGRSVGADSDGTKKIGPTLDPNGSK